MQRAINRRLARFGMRLNSQNLCDLSGGRKGPMWRAGRAWLWLRDDERGNNPKIGVEWRLGRWAFGASLGINERYGDDDLTLALNLPGISLYLSPDRVLPSWVPRPNEPHSTGFYVREGGLWWNVWQNDFEYRSDTPRWRHGHFDPVDWLLGRSEFSRRLLHSTETVVPMPERSYPATVKMEEHTWTRPRWPWSRRLLRADISVEGGIPVPGKGENSYDCGQDAVYALTTRASTVPEAVAKLVRSCLERRARYGGPDWRPEPVAGSTG